MIPNITLVIQGLAFFAVALLVMKFMWPPIIAAIEERQAKIAEGLAAADRARQELADADARVAD
ncbi:MAG: F0F1 ATP synthase subunit B, partial [Xanthomonadales bacterium]|nr:F0F1 ATP synthase subunit B [Xanthomonadales bacterium]